MKQPLEKRADAIERVRLEIQDDIKNAIKEIDQLQMQGIIESLKQNGE